VKLKLRFAAICCLAACIVTPAFAQNSGADTYKAKCAMCHGADGLGATPAGKALKAVPFNDPAVVKAPDAELIADVKNGKGKMTPNVAKLTDDQIKSVVAFIRTFQK
jgi:mono/diheme cytochrome c family protein